MAGTTIADLVVNIGANISGLASSLRDAVEQLDQAEKTMKSDIDLLSRAFTLLESNIQLSVREVDKLIIKEAELIRRQYSAREAIAATSEKLLQQREDTKELIKQFDRLGASASDLGKHTLGFKGAGDLAAQAESIGKAFRSLVLDTSTTSAEMARGLTAAATGLHAVRLEADAIPASVGKLETARIEVQALASALDRLGGSRGAGGRFQVPNLDIARSIFGTRSDEDIISKINLIESALQTLREGLDRGIISQQEFNRNAGAAGTQLTALKTELTGVIPAEDLLAQRINTANAALQKQVAQLQENAIKVQVYREQLAKAAGTAPPAPLPPEAPPSTTIPLAVLEIRDTASILNQIKLVQEAFAALKNSDADILTVNRALQALNSTVATLKAEMNGLPASVNALSVARAEAQNLLVILKQFGSGNLDIARSILGGDGSSADIVAQIRVIKVALGQLYTAYKSGTSDVTLDELTVKSKIAQDQIAALTQKSKGLPPALDAVTVATNAANAAFERQVAQLGQDAALIKVYREELAKAAGTNILPAQIVLKFRGTTEIESELDTVNAAMQRVIASGAELSTRSRAFQQWIADVVRLKAELNGLPASVNALAAARANVESIAKSLEESGAGNADIAHSVLGTIPFADIQAKARLVETSLSQMFDRFDRGIITEDEFAVENRAAAAQLAGFEKQMRGTVPTIDAMTAATNAATASFERQVAQLAVSREETAKFRAELDKVGPGNLDSLFAGLKIRPTADIRADIDLTLARIAKLKEFAAAGIIDPQTLTRGLAAASAQLKAFTIEMDGAGAKTALTSRSFIGLFHALSFYALISAGIKLKEFVGYIIDAGDAAIQMQARLRLLTDSQAEASELFQQLGRDAIRLRVPIEDNISSFSRLAFAVENIGGSTDDARKLNEVLQASGKIYGATAEELRASTLQFSQALGSGTLRGDEFRSMVENNQEAVRQLAAALGVSIAELRKMSAEGRLTADVFGPALLSRLDIVRQKFASIPVTFTESVTVLKDQVFLMLASLNDAISYTQRLAAGVTQLANALNELRKGNTQQGLLGLVPSIGAAARSVSWVVPGAAVIDAMSQSLDLLPVLAKGAESAIDRLFSSAASAADPGVIVRYSDRLNDVGESANTAEPKVGKMADTSTVLLGAMSSELGGNLGDYVTDLGTDAETATPLVQAFINKLIILLGLKSKRSANFDFIEQTNEIAASLSDIPGSTFNADRFGLEAGIKASLAEAHKLADGFADPVKKITDQISKISQAWDIAIEKLKFAKAVLLRSGKDETSPEVKDIDKELADSIKARDYSLIEAGRRLGEAEDAEAKKRLANAKRDLGSLDARVTAYARVYEIEKENSENFAKLQENQLERHQKLVEFYAQAGLITERSALQQRNDDEIQSARLSVAALQTRYDAKLRQIASVKSEPVAEGDTEGAKKLENDLLKLEKERLDLKQQLQLAELKVGDLTIAGLASALLYTNKLRDQIIGIARASQDYAISLKDQIEQEQLSISLIGKSETAQKQAQIDRDAEVKIAAKRLEIERKLQDLQLGAGGGDPKLVAALNDELDAFVGNTLKGATAMKSLAAETFNVQQRIKGINDAWQSTQDFVSQLIGHMTEGWSSAVQFMKDTLKRVLLQTYTEYLTKEIVLPIFVKFTGADQKALEDQSFPLLNIFNSLGSGGIFGKLFGTTAPTGAKTKTPDFANLTLETDKSSRSLTGLSAAMADAITASKTLSDAFVEAAQKILEAAGLSIDRATSSLRTAPPETLPGFVGPRSALAAPTAEAVSLTDSEIKLIRDTGDDITTNFVSGVSASLAGLPRGIRNFNPGNITWTGTALFKGETGAEPEGKFAQFDTMEHGLQAIATNLTTYQDKYGLRTVDEIISRWSTTDREAYIAAVTSKLGVGPRDQIDVHEPDTMRKLVDAIIQQENGQKYTAASLQKLSETIASRSSVTDQYKTKASPPETGIGTKTEFPQVDAAATDLAGSIKNASVPLDTFAARNPFGAISAQLDARETKLASTAGSAAEEFAKISAKDFVGPLEIAGPPAIDYGPYEDGVSRLTARVNTTEAGLARFDGSVAEAALGIKVPAEQLTDTFKSAAVQLSEAPKAIQPFEGIKPVADVADFNQGLESATTKVTELGDAVNIDKTGFDNFNKFLVVTGPGIEKLGQTTQQANVSIAKFDDGIGTFKSFFSEAKAEVPKIEIPKIEVPKIEVPKIDFSPAEDSISRMQARAESATENVSANLAALSADAAAAGDAQITASANVKNSFDAIEDSSTKLGASQQKLVTDLAGVDVTGLGGQFSSVTQTVGTTVPYITSLGKASGATAEAVTGFGNKLDSINVDTGLRSISSQAEETASDLGDAAAAAGRVASVTPAFTESLRSLDSSFVLVSSRSDDLATGFGTITPAITGNLRNLDASFDQTASTTSAAAKNTSDSFTKVSKTSQALGGGFYSLLGVLGGFAGGLGAIFRGLQSILGFAGGGGGGVGGIGNTLSNFGTSVANFGTASSNLVNTLGGGVYGQNFPGGPSGGFDMLPNTNPTLFGSANQAAIGDLFSGATLSGVLAGAGIGYAIGSLGAKFFGNAGNQTGIQVGGTIGGTIGAAVAGPIGAVVGSVLGSLVGSLFGGHEPAATKGQFQITPRTTTTGFEDNKFTASSFGNLGFADAATQYFSGEAAQAFNRMVGGALDAFKTRFSPEQSARLAGILQNTTFPEAKGKTVSTEEFIKEYGGTVLQQVVAAAFTVLDPALGEVASRFTGTAEEVAKFADTLLSIHDATTTFGDNFAVQLGTVFVTSFEASKAAITTAATGAITSAVGAVGAIKPDTKPLTEAFQNVKPDPKILTGSIDSSVDTAFAQVKPDSKPLTGVVSDAVTDAFGKVPKAPVQAVAEAVAQPKLPTKPNAIPTGDAEAEQAAKDFVKTFVDNINAALADATQATADKVLAFVNTVNVFADALPAFALKLAALNPDQMLAFVDALGGAQKLAESTQFIAANFVSSADRMVAAQNKLQTGFTSLNLTAEDLAKAGLTTFPKTHEEFLALLASFDPATEAGASMIAMLLTLAPAFVEVNGTIDQATERLKAFKQSIALIAQANPNTARILGNPSTAVRNAVGGQQQYDQAVGYVASNFTTNANRFAVDLGRLNDVFGPLGISVPRTHAEFLAVLATFNDANDPLGKTRALILGVADAFVDMNGTAEQVAQDQQNREERFRSNTAFFTPEQQNSYRVNRDLGFLDTIGGRLGVSLPQTSQAFAQWLTTIDRTTDAGENLYREGLKLIDIYIDLNDAQQGAAQSAQALGIALRGEAAQTITDQFTTLMGTINDFVSGSDGSFGDKGALKISLIQEQIGKFRTQLANVAQQYFSPSFWSFLQTDQHAFDINVQGLASSDPVIASLLNILNQLNTALDDSSAHLEKFLDYSALYGDDIAEKLVNLDDQYSAQQTALTGNAIALAASTAWYNRQRDAIINGTDDAGKSLDDFIKKIHDLAEAAGGKGNEGQKAGIELALLTPHLADLQAQYAKLDPLSPVARALLVDITKLKTYGANLATEIAHFATYQAQYGTDIANSLVQLEEWYTEQQEALAGNAAALAILGDIFNQQFTDIINGVDKGTNNLIDSIKKIKDYLEQLKIGQLSPLTPFQKFQEAQSKFNEQLALAQHGDSTALENITQYADSYLQLARDAYASSPAYTAIYDAVTASLTGLTTAVTPPAAPAIATPTATTGTTTTTGTTATGTATTTATGATATTTTAPDYSVVLAAISTTLTALVSASQFTLLHDDLVAILDAIAAPATAQVTAAEAPIVQLQTTAQVAPVEPESTGFAALLAAVVAGTAEIVAAINALAVPTAIPVTTATTTVETNVSTSTTVENVATQISNVATTLNQVATTLNEINTALQTSISNSSNTSNVANSTSQLTQVTNAIDNSIQTQTAATTNLTNSVVNETSALQQVSNVFNQKTTTTEVVAQSVPSVSPPPVDYTSFFVAIIEAIKGIIIVPSVATTSTTTNIISSALTQIANTLTDVSTAISNQAQTISSASTTNSSTTSVSNVATQVSNVATTLNQVATTLTNTLVQIADSLTEVSTAISNQVQTISSALTTNSSTTNTSNVATQISDVATTLNQYQVAEPIAPEVVDYLKSIADNSAAITASIATIATSVLEPAATPLPEPVAVAPTPIAPAPIALNAELAALPQSTASADDLAAQTTRLEEKFDSLEQTVAEMLLALAQSARDNAQQQIDGSRRDAQVIIDGLGGSLK